MIQNLGKEYLPNCLKPKFAKPYFTSIWAAITNGHKGLMVL